MKLSALLAEGSWLLDRFRDDPDEPDEATLRREWRSVVCRACGACCHSSLVPVTEADFDAFHRRLAPKMSRDDLAALFLQPATAAPGRHLETAAHGGCCMFLGREGSFYCDCWDQRPEVCREFFCWPMTRFALFEAGEPVEEFDPALPWMENLARLVTAVEEEAAGSLFADDRNRYLRHVDTDRRPSWCETHRERFTHSRTRGIDPVS